jgi:hypothetical protein
MLGTGDDSITRRRAVAQRAREGAAKQVLRQGRLNATVSLIGALAAADSVGPDDYRRFFMAWQATRVLRPAPAAFLPAALQAEPPKRRACELKARWRGGEVTTVRDTASPDDGRDLR